MFDIEFYMKVYDLKKRLMSGEKMEREFLMDTLESYRSKDPVVYNIETTNACNMRCEMCPRTTIMTRPIETMSPDIFKRVIDQLKPFSPEQLERWEDFVVKNYGIAKNDMSENHYFLYVIPRVIVLHGYGDPLLDKNMPQYVKWMTERNLESYFSCNPANINMDRTIETFENGLGYVKYSIESVDDLRHKEVRGQASNFTESYRNIMTLLDLKAQRNYKTTIVITMINLNKSWQQDEFEKLKEAFAGCDVYIYLKSQDQMWYEDNRQQTQSIHWIEFCQFPWSSMTIKSNGESAECVEDFDNEIILGDARKQTLYDIWNGDKYKAFRNDHFILKPGIKCTEQCDMTLIGSYLAAKESVN
ncbi:MAG: SPASM domain-containing protein [Anaerolineaceae bacterium]|nr:SPASM domain-containing protein [Anaerolineaceae bacterium]